MKRFICTRAFLLDLLALIFGSALFGISVSVFSAPNKIASGGVTGLSTVLYYMTGAPISISIIVMNIPLFIAVSRISTRKFMVKTIIAVIFTSLAVDATGALLPTYTGDKLLASLFAGVLMGVGLGIMFSRGMMTGGSDLAAKLIKHKLPHFPIGQLLFVIDAAVVSIAAIAFKSLESGLYAAVVIFVSSRAIDAVLSGIDNAKAVYIISSKKDEIIEAVFLKLSRGVTILPGYGGFTGSPVSVLLCVVRLEESPKLKEIVSAIDPKAFIIISEASAVYGEGFKIREHIE